MTNPDPIEQQLRKDLEKREVISDYNAVVESEFSNSLEKVEVDKYVDEMIALFDTYAARRADEVRKKALQWALNDYNMPDTDTASNLKAYIAELNHKEPIMTNPNPPKVASENTLREQVNQAISSMDVDKFADIVYMKSAPVIDAIMQAFTAAMETVINPDTPDFTRLETNDFNKGKYEGWGAFKKVANQRLAEMVGKK